jgi:protein-tyrosine phosphatase
MQIRAKVKLILDEIYPGENREVPDPYYGGDEGFQQVFDMLDDATDQLIARYID